MDSVNTDDKSIPHIIYTIFILHFAVHCYFNCCKMWDFLPIFVFILHTYSESTKQMEQTLRAKVKIFFKSENLKKMLLIKNDGLIGFI